jgi:hypothetical protein
MSDTTNTEADVPMDTAFRERKSPVWDMSQERMFIENLLSQRFGFFLVAFSLVVAGAISCRVQLHLQIVLTLGAIVTFLFARVLGRSQEKLDIILAELWADPTHPATIVDKRAREGGSQRRLIGVWIPWFCYHVLIAGAALEWLRILEVSNVGP